MNPTKLAIILLLTVVHFLSYSQENEHVQKKIKLFLDCNNVFCDQTYIRSEINIIDFVFDRIAADVHVLVTAQPLGNGGRKYQMIFFGQKSFSDQRDTLRFNMLPLQLMLRSGIKFYHI